MKAYIQKPIIIQAVQWNGKNDLEIIDFCGDNAVFERHPQVPLTLYIRTPEGILIARLGSYIIKGVGGKFYPCKEDIFNATYDELNDYEL